MHIDYLSYSLESRVGCVGKGSIFEVDKNSLGGLDVKRETNQLLSSVVCSTLVSSACPVTHDLASDFHFF